MDYKKIIKSRSIRMSILNFLSFIPDKIMLKIQYRIKTHRKLNLKNPKRYTEKVQWYKLYYKNPLMIKCVDKYEVRDYIKKKGLEKILLKCFGVYEKIEDIPWKTLPEQFVIKDTLGAGGTSVIIVDNKEKLNIKEIESICAKWLSTKNIRTGGREWPYYSGKKHRILIEEYICSEIEKGGIIDYKFLCFNGKVVLVNVLADRVLGQGAGCGIYNRDFIKLPYQELDEFPLKREIEKPQNYDEMLKIAEELSKDFPLVRVDLYNEKNKIKFGELTFYDASGYMLFEPDEFDYELGKKLNLEKIND